MYDICQHMVSIGGFSSFDIALSYDSKQQMRPVKIWGEAKMTILPPGLFDWGQFVYPVPPPPIEPDTTVIALGLGVSHVIFTSRLKYTSYLELSH